MSSKNMVDHPDHYNIGKFEVIEVIEDWNLNFNLGNAIKYIARAGHKGTNKTVEDLNKAIWYLNREANKLVKAAPNSSIDFHSAESLLDADTVAHKKINFEDTCD